MGQIFKIIHFTSIFWKWYLFMGFFVVVVSLLTLVTPLLSKQIVDLIVDQMAGNNLDYSLLVWLLAGILSSDILITFLTTFGQWIGDMLAVKLQTYLSEKFYKHILELHIGY